jgi:hypothetical protein
VPDHFHIASVSKGSSDQGTLCACTCKRLKKVDKSMPRDLQACHKIAQRLVKRLENAALRSMSDPEKRQPEANKQQHNGHLADYNFQIAGIQLLYRLFAASKDLDGCSGTACREVRHMQS